MMTPLRHATHVALGLIAALALMTAGLVAPATAGGDNDSWEQVAGELLNYGHPKAFAQDDTDETNVQAVGEGPDGETVILIDEAKDAPEHAEDGSFTEAELKEKYGDDVEVKDVGEITSTSDTDVVGGAPIHGPSGNSPQLLCSLGFAAWDSSGNPAAVTAGHCNDSGSFHSAGLNDPEYEDAAGGGDEFRFMHDFGTYGSWQFGKADNSSDDGFSVDATDFGVIDVTNDDLTLSPEVTTWTTPEDLSKSTTNISDVGAIDPHGAKIEKSGRTTGHTEAPAANIDIVDGVAKVGGKYPVRGFGIDDFMVQPGDSGSPVYQDETAIGVLSGGTAQYLWAASIEKPLAATDGYTLQLHVDAPEVTSPEDGGTVGAGEKIAGTAKPGSTLVVNPDDDKKFEVDVNGGGAWSFKAPDSFGTYSFSAKAKNGFNESDSVQHEVDVTLPAPKLTSPADGGKVTGPVTQVSGKGQPGATVSLSGAVEDTAKVDSDGTWKVKADLDYGNHKYYASQELDGVESKEVSAEVAVAPAPPKIDSLSDGDTVPVNRLPGAIAGSGMDGATVDLKVNGKDAGTADVSDGQWQISMPERVSTGDHRITASQQSDGVSSKKTSMQFTVIDTPAGSDRGNGSDADNAVSFGDGDPSSTPGFLPSTGAAAGLWAVMGIALLLIMTGSVALLSRLRRA